MLGELERQVGNLDRAAALLAEALQLALDAGSTPHAANIEHGLGDTALTAGDTAAAERHYLRALSRARKWGNPNSTACCLAGLASVEAKRGECERAGRLWGASEAFDRESGITLLPHELAVYEDALARVAGPQFEEAAGETRQLEPDHALAVALKEHGASP